jgi:hypothetical protein
MTGSKPVEGHAPSVRERHEIAAASERQKKRPPRVSINIKQPENGPIEISHSRWRMRDPRRRAPERHASGLRRARDAVCMNGGNGQR